MTDQRAIFPVTTFRILTLLITKLQKLRHVLQQFSKPSDYVSKGHDLR